MDQQPPSDSLEINPSSNKPDKVWSVTKQLLDKLFDDPKKESQIKAIEERAIDPEFREILARHYFSQFELMRANAANWNPSATDILKTPKLSLQDPMKAQAGQQNAIDAINNALKLAVNEYDNSKLIYDELTGLLNRKETTRQLDQFLENIIESHINQQRNQFTQDKNKRKTNQFPVTQFAIVMFDADHFKDINDTYGHPMGDEALKHIAATFKSVFRQGDILGRFGGEEFLGICPNHDPNIENSAFKDIFDKRRRSVSDNPYAHANGNPLKVTLSAGVVIVSKVELYERYNHYFSVTNNHHDTILKIREELIKTTDQALYKAKETRNCTVVLNLQDL